MHRTMPLLILALPLLAIGPISTAAGQGPYPRMAPLAQYLASSPTAEIALARSGAPIAVSGKAEILVLGAHGYVTGVQGNNGFVCFVGRSWAQDFDASEFWNSRIRTPQCWNAAAVSSELPDYLKRTQWVLAGLSRKAMATRTKAAWAAHEFGPPAPQSMAYMMSKDQYIKDAQSGVEPNWYPHVMFFVPATQAATWGANVAGAPTFSATSSAEPITTFFLIVPKWSDGSLGPYIPTQAAAKNENQRNR